ncbi:MAG: hypothetical protein ACMG6E_05760 [Candidatus Roizmanbacteria bacterium]
MRELISKNFCYVNEKQIKQKCLALLKNSPYSKKASPSKGDSLSSYNTN